MEIKATLTGKKVILSAEDSKFLWENGFYGISPAKNTRIVSPLYGTLALYEASYLLKQCATGQLDFSFSIQRTTQEEPALSPESFIAFIKRDNKSYIRAVVYEKLRSLGWIVHSGINYGADYLLYQSSPEEEHASYAVIVRKAPEGDLTWQEVIAFNRVIATANKAFVIAYVYEATTDYDNNGGEYDVKFLHISRWHLDCADRKSPNDD